MLSAAVVVKAEDANDANEHHNPDAGEDGDCAPRNFTAEEAINLRRR